MDSTLTTQASRWATWRTLLVFLLAGLLVRTLGVEAFVIPSGSMIPTLVAGDYLLVSKMSYGYSRYSLPGFLVGLMPRPAGTTADCQALPGRLLGRMPRRGDVAVFKLPRRPEIDFVKRIVGLPCDRLQMVGGVLVVNGRPVDRQPIAAYPVTEILGRPVLVPQYLETLPGGRTHPIIERQGDSGEMDNTPVYQVPPGHVFAMGDNRDDSQDSRYPEAVGFIPLENLVGAAQITFLSIDPDAPGWKFWQWPSAIRWSRLFRSVR